MMGLIDGLIVDLQDVAKGLHLPIHSARLHEGGRRSGQGIILLDRPTPWRLMVEGNLLKPELYSFVGPYRLPMRHGLTLEKWRAFQSCFRS